jgi:disulfide bond formation protein DsbB
MEDERSGNLITRFSLYIALLAAWIAMLGSLYFSQVKGYLPCDLCWYQRILMYPLAAIIAVGLLRRDSNLPYYVLPLSLLGQAIATYHYLLEKTDLFPTPATCQTSVPCTVVWINWFGFITIPFLSMTAFFIITIMSLVALTAGEPQEEADTRTPWWQVGSVIAVVIAGFVLLYGWDSASASTLTLTELPGGDQTPITAATPMPTNQAGAQTAFQTEEDSPAADLAQGQQLYQGTCAVCHGLDAHGLPNLGPSLVESTVVHGSDAEALALIRNGVALDDPRNTTGLVMPPSGGRPELTDEQLLAILAWLRAQ